ncbi:MAG: hypothetical protein QF463_13290, partial [Vicinamibacterales bacterium]|nr:hypothetical protein [Vicinamibacterales bacterium]
MKYQLDHVINAVRYAARTPTAKAVGTRPSKAGAIVAVAVTLGLFVASTSAAAQQQEGTQGESVVLAFDEVVDSVESIVLGEFRPGVDALRTNLSNSLARARRACSRAEGTGDPTVGLDCDEAIAEGFATTGEDLAHIVDLREPVLGATDALIDSIGDALIAADEQDIRLERAGERRRDEIAQALATLEEISGQYSDYITEDRPLPIEVDVRVRALEQQRLLGEMRRSVHEEHRANLDEVRQALAGREQQARILRGEYWSSPGFPDGLVRLGKGGFMLGRTSLAESGVPPLPIVEDLDVLKEIRP